METNQKNDNTCFQQKKYNRIGELLDEFHATKDVNPEYAHTVIQAACACMNTRAMLEYSRFLRTTPLLSVSQNARYRTAEKILLALNNLLDVHVQFSIDVALETATLYSECLHRPVGALGMCLYAKRIGGSVDDQQIRYLQKKMVDIDINHLGNNYRDSLLVGQELFRAGSTSRLTELFLREAKDKSYEALKHKERGARLVYAQACLTLGDFYDSQQDTAPFFISERNKLYAEARTYGFPEYLR